MSAPACPRCQLSEQLVTRMTEVVGELYQRVGDVHEAMVAAIDQHDGDADIEDAADIEAEPDEPEYDLTGNGDRHDQRRPDCGVEGDGSADDEPSLGATEGPTSEGWDYGGQDETEPSLAAPEGLDQRRWALPNYVGTDLEEACDDEGHDSDREPDCDAEPEEADGVIAAHVDDQRNWSGATPGFTNG